MINNLQIYIFLTKNDLFFYKPAVNHITTTYITNN